MKDEQLKKAKPYWQYVILGILLLVCWSVQSAPENLLMIGGVRPVLLVALTAAVGIVYGAMTGGVFGLIAGMLMDVYTTPSVAFNAAMLTFLGIFCGLAIKHLFMNNKLSAMVLIFAVSLLYFVTYWLLFKVILGGGGGFVYLYRFSLTGAVYTGLWGILLYPLTRLIRRYL